MAHVPRQSSGHPLLLQPEHAARAWRAHDAGGLCPQYFIRRELLQQARRRTPSNGWGDQSSPYMRCELSPTIRGEAAQGAARAAPFFHPPYVSMEDLHIRQANISAEKIRWRPPDPLSAFLMTKIQENPEVAQEKNTSVDQPFRVIREAEIRSVESLR